jgi:hypothetical protein
MNFKEKYLKYKNKYITLKTQIGGTSSNNKKRKYTDEIPYLSDFFYSSSSKCLSLDYLISVYNAKGITYNFEQLNNSLAIRIHNDLNSNEFLNANIEDLFNINAFNHFNTENKDHFKMYIKKCRLISLYKRYIPDNLTKMFALQKYFLQYVGRRNKEFLKNYSISSLGRPLDKNGDIAPLIREYFYDWNTYADVSARLPYGTYVPDVIPFSKLPNKVSKILPHEFNIDTINLLLKETIIGKNTNRRSNDIYILMKLGAHVDDYTIANDEFSKRNLKFLYIPSFVNIIGTHAFAENNLTSVIIPNSVTKIDNYAFVENNLTSVIIPNSVTFIGDNAFAGQKEPVVPVVPVVPDAPDAPDAPDYISIDKAFSVLSIPIDNAPDAIDYIPIDNVTIPIIFKNDIERIFYIRPTNISYTSDENDIVSYDDFGVD